MMRPTRFNFIPNYGDTNDPVVRAKYGYLEATISILGNTFLFIIKLILGIYINSIALIADAVHSLSDISTSGIVIFGFRIAKKQPDRYPHIINKEFIKWDLIGKTSYNLCKIFRKINKKLVLALINNLLSITGAVH